MKNYFDYNNGKLYYEVLGELHEETLVFVHGFSLDNRMWDKQKRFFSENYRVVTYDMRGFGKATIPNGVYSHHDDLYHLLQHLGIDSCYLVGLSLGGEVAIDFILEYPSLVKRLILMDSSLGGYASTVNWDVKAKQEGIGKATQNWLNHEVFSITRKNQGVAKQLEVIVKDYSGWHWVNKDPRMKLDPPAIDRLNEVKQATLILVGDKDLEYFKDISLVLNKGIVSSARIFINQAGHMINMEKTEEVNELIASFIDK